MNAQQMFTLKALAPEGKLVNDREYIRLSNELITVELAFDCLLEKNILFDLVLINETDHPVFVNPSSFFYLKLDDPEGDSSSYPPVMALAPLQPFTWYDRGLEESQHGSAFTTLLEIPASIMEEFVAAWTDESPVGPAQEKERIEGVKETVRQEMMQERELKPGEVANGFIYFPGLPETIFLLFCFPLDEHEFQFAYQIELSHP